MSMHTGHRDRLRQRFVQEGLDGFTPVQALELLLFYGVPRKDTNPIAHTLMDTFGSLSQVMDAPLEELMKASGMTANAAILLHLAKAMGRVYQVDRMAHVDIMSTIEDCAAYLSPHFHGRTVETMFLLCLDAKGKVLACREVGEGGINEAHVNIRAIVQTAISLGATSVVFAHNHPSGIALPSQEDVLTTRRIATALELVDVFLLDSLIFVEDDYVSLASSGVSVRGMGV